MDGRVEVELPREPSSASRARQLVADLSADTLHSEERNPAKLLVSELVTNAVVHGTGVITLRASIDENRLLVEVIDEGSGSERVARQHDLHQLGGLGLSVVDAEASRWGVHAGTWFEIERAGRTSSSSKPATPSSCATPAVASTKR
jgi:serine/threonine-protein kinase RsbW